LQALLRFLAGVLVVADKCRATTKTSTTYFFFLAAFLAFLAFFFVAMVHSFRFVV